MSNILTATQFLRQKFDINEDKPVSEYLTDIEFEETMIEFAQMHVKECKLQIIEQFSIPVYKDSILNTYPLTLIK